MHFQKARARMVAIRAAYGSPMHVCACVCVCVLLQGTRGACIVRINHVPE